MGNFDYLNLLVHHGILCRPQEVNVKRWRVLPHIDTMNKNSSTQSTEELTNSDVPLTLEASSVKKLRIYRRIAFGRKHLFAPSDSDPAEYFVLNPVPHKHAKTWTPVFYRGDNPKYDTSSRKVARAWRTALWGSFRIELGDGVHEVLENRRRMREKKWHERKQKFRKFFMMKPKAPKIPLEELQPVEGFVMVLEMRRTSFFTRSLRWQLGEQVFTWTGTRRFLPKWASRWKAISHDLKLVDANNVVVATLEKDRWASYKSSVKAEGTANKSKTFLGTLSIHTETLIPITSAEIKILNAGNSSAVDSGIEGESKYKKKLTKNLNLDGQHAGDLLEEALVFTCWIALEGEHRLRYKIFDLIEEIGEMLGG